MYKYSILYQTKFSLWLDTVLYMHIRTHSTFMDFSKMLVVAYMVLIEIKMKTYKLEYI